LSHPNLISIDWVWCHLNYIVVAMELAHGSLRCRHGGNVNGLVRYGGDKACRVKNPNNLAASAEPSRVARPKAVGLARTKRNTVRCRTQPDGISG
jgi:hypothetical protein